MYCSIFPNFFWQKFRESNFLTNDQKELITRNFSEIYSHTVWSLQIFVFFCIFVFVYSRPLVWSCHAVGRLVFWKISVKSTSLVKSFTLELISRNNSYVIQKFRKLHTVSHNAFFAWQWFSRFSTLWWRVNF